MNSQPIGMTDSSPKTTVNRIARLGAAIWSQAEEIRYAAAVIGTVLYISLRPRCWVPAVRKAFVRQVMVTGIEPLWFVGCVAVCVGISVVVQFTFWTGEAGLSQLLGPLLVTVVARELGPVLINLIVIVRSGSAMTAELGLLKMDGGLEATDTAGPDPLSHLVLPRVLGMTVSTFCLTVVFILTAFASGYLFAAGAGMGSGDVSLFANTLSNALQSKDVVNIIAKSIIPALFSSVSCCIAGLSVGNSPADLPQATRRALTRSVVGLFVISAIVSLLTYW